MGHPAKYRDAGLFFRVGASDYLDLNGLKTAQLLESLVVVSAFIEAKRQAESATGDNEASEKSLPLTFLDTGEMDTLPDSVTDKASYEEMRAEFINTGIMDILQRDELRKIVDEQNED